MSSLFLRTLRDDPADAEVDSHRLLVRAGYIRRVAAGHLLVAAARLPGAAQGRADRAGGDGPRRARRRPCCRSSSRSSCGSAPAATRRTARSCSGSLDRKETGFCLSPTAEEVVTTIVAQEYTSYRDLPVNLYQINWKYRDELRPASGCCAAASS